MPSSRYPPTLLPLLLLPAVISSESTTCGSLEPALNRTACPEFFSCCHHQWSESEGKWGCAPFPDAVCCPSGYYACPSGHECIESGSSPPWNNTVKCLPPDGAPDAPTSQAERICKNGPSVPFSETLKNVLILGDSVSIGYTPFVASSLADLAFVQHTPWDIRDGGAADAGYGYRCLFRFLSAADGTPLRPDVLYFNYGIHSCLPGSEEEKNYIMYLSWIVQELTAWAKGNDNSDGVTNKAPVQLIFGLTTPWLNSKEKDDVIVEHNVQVQRLMERFHIPTVDLHAPIIAKCGSVPQQSCFNQTECWSPHCPGIGYEWLANATVTPAIRELLLEDSSVARGRGGMSAVE